MNVSLSQAVEIHAKVLKRRTGYRAPALARERASRCATAGDADGNSVWLEVASIVDRLLMLEFSGDGQREKDKPR
jgi:hypothetical protein